MATIPYYRIRRMSVADFERYFPDEYACEAYLTHYRWADGKVRCPRCGSEAQPHGTKPFHWLCYHCAPETSYRFSVLTDTIFEGTNKPLRDWFRVMRLMLTSKKGMSAMQIFRYMGYGSYKTAWLMCSKIRFALGNVEFRKMVGYVKVDETYVGGKAKKKHKIKAGRAGMGGAGGMAKSNRNRRGSVQG